MGEEVEDTQCPLWPIFLCHVSQHTGHNNQCDLGGNVTPLLRMLFGQQAFRWPSSSDFCSLAENKRGEKVTAIIKGQVAGSAYRKQGVKFTTQAGGPHYLQKAVFEFKNVLSFETLASRLFIWEGVLRSTRREVGMKQKRMEANQGYVFEQAAAVSNGGSHHPEEPERQCRPSLGDNLHRGYLASDSLSHWPRATPKGP